MNEKITKQEHLVGSGQLENASLFCEICDQDDTSLEVDERITKLEHLVGSGRTT